MPAIATRPAGGAVQLTAGGVGVAAAQQRRGLGVEEADDAGAGRDAARLAVHLLVVGAGRAQHLDVAHALTRWRPPRDTSTSSGGFSHSHTGITAGVPVTAGAPSMCGALLLVGAPQGGGALDEAGQRGGRAAAAGSPGTPSPMSSRVTGRCSRAARTSQIRSGTWPRGRWPFNHRATAVCSYRRASPRARPAWFTWAASPACEMPASSRIASSRVLGCMEGPPEAHGQLVACVRGGRTPDGGYRTADAVQSDTASSSGAPRRTAATLRNHAVRRLSRLPPL